MKAIVWTKYGSPDGLQLREVETPVPQENEVRIRVQAATVTAGDCEVRSLDLAFPFNFPIRLYAGVLRPTRITILGQELSGDVESVGKEVTRFKEGDPVCASTGLRFGGYAEYACLPQNAVMTIKPATIPYTEAATLPTGGLEALHFIRKANIQRGETMLILGAGGSIGTFAVQLARNAGAEITAVDAASKLDMLRSLGAAHVIDYTQQDFTQNGQTYDVIFDVIGKSHFSRSVQSLKEHGRYLIGNPSMSMRTRAGRISRTTSKAVITEAAAQKTEDLIFLRELIEADKLKSVIDRSFPLEQTAEAHRYVETGQKQGNVVITVG